MSFTRIHVWSTNEVLTSAQMNEVSLDLSNALDKANGDTITGPVLLGLGGSITATQPQGIVSLVFFGIVSNVSNGIASFAAGGIQPAVAQGIQTTIADGISSAAPGGIGSDVPGGIQSNAVGGFNLNGGTGDWLTFSQKRTMNLMVPLLPMAVGSGWTAASQTLIGVDNGSTTFIPLSRIIGGQFNGATLTSASLFMSVGTVHTGLPGAGNMPGFTILRRSFVFTILGGGALDEALFVSSPQRFAVPGSVNAWYANGTIQQLTAAPNQNNVIDTGTYQYFVQLYDESGTNAQSGNSFFAVQLTFSNIGNDAPC